MVINRETLEKALKYFTTSSRQVSAKLQRQIITGIFEYLPYPYFQDVRLVCKTWYLASVASKILDREKVVFDENFCEVFPFSFVQESQRDFLHLILKRYSSEGLNAARRFFDKTFWERFGPNLKTLTFNRCSYIDSKELIEILSCCPNLNSLEFNWCGFRSKKDSTNFEDLVGMSKLPNFSEEALTDTEDWNGMPELPNLERIKFKDTKTRENRQAVGILDQLLSSAPNLNTLLLDWRWFGCGDLFEYTGLDELSRKRLLEYVSKNSSQIVRFSLYDAFEDAGRDFLVDLLKTPNLNLISLETNYAFPIEQVHRLKSLRTLETGLKRNKNDPNAANANVECVERICRELSNLENLSIVLLRDSSAIISLSPIPYVLQNLSSLYLDLQIFPLLNDAMTGVNSNILLGLCSNINATLKKLTLIIDVAIHTDTVVKLASCYPSLSYFKLESMLQFEDTAFFQAICKHQPRLQYLQISTDGLDHDGEPMDPVIYREKDQEFDQLKDLRHFKSSLPGLFEKKNCPELRHLNLDSLISVDVLKFIVLNHPMLEKLKCYVSGQLTEELVDLIVDHLKRLKYLSIGTEKKNSEEIMKKLKDHCLRVRLTSRR